jgi:hypothetical protein
MAAFWTFVHITIIAEKLDIRCLRWYPLFMIKFENNMLVLDSSFSKSDEIAIKEFISTVKKQERSLIANQIKAKLEIANKTRTPLFAEPGLEMALEIIEGS